MPLFGRSRSDFRVEYNRQPTLSKHRSSKVPPTLLKTPEADPMPIQTSPTLPSSESFSNNSSKGEPENPAEDTPTSQRQSQEAVIAKDEEAALLRAQLEREIRDMTLQQLVQQLQAVRSSKEVPQTIEFEGQDEDLRSVVSKLTMPEEISSLAGDMARRRHLSSMPCQYQNIRNSSQRQRNLVGRSTVKRMNSIRKHPPLPLPKNAQRDPNKAFGMEVEMDLNDRTLQGLYSGGLDANGLPSGMGVVKFENNDLYIGDFWNGKMHGHGTLMFDGELGTGAVLKGDFEHNKYVI